MRRTWIVLVVATMTFSMALAQPVRVVPDVPTEAPSGSGTTYPPWEIIENDAGVYSPEASAATEPSAVRIDAAWEIFKNQWIVSIADTAELGGTTFRRSDIIDWNASSGTFILARSQESAGIPDGSNLDAIFRDPQNRELILSFDVPTTINSVTYQPADLARFDNSAVTFNGHFLDASTLGIPDSVNLIAAEARGTRNCSSPGPYCTRVVFSLDIPTTLGPTTYLPGDLILWEGEGTQVSLFQSQTGWPISSQVEALSFRGAPGKTPPNITIEKVDATTLRLHWNATECSGLEHHAIYQGTVSSVRGGTYDHTEIDCFDSLTKLQEDITLPGADSYFLVVPTSQTEEGSYGQDSGGVERPVGTSTCESVQNLDEC